MQNCNIKNFFFFNDTATTEIYTLSLHDALPISSNSIKKSDTLLYKNDHFALIRRFSSMVSIKFSRSDLLFAGRFEVSIDSSVQINAFQTFYTCLATSIGQYIYDYYLKTHVPTMDSIQENERFVSITTNLNHIQCDRISITESGQQWAQQQSSNLFFYQTVASSIPTIVMTYILGLYTHHLGRKFVLILTMLGNVFQYSIWLCIIYFQVSQ